MILFDLIHITNEVNISLYGLGYHTLRVYGNKMMQFLASFYIYNSVNVLIKHVRIEDGNGTGLAITDTTGYVEVAYSFFKNNSIKGNGSLSGGRRTYCPPGTLQKMNCYFNTSSLLHQLQTCFRVLSFLLVWTKQGNSCLSMNVLDTHAIHDTQPTFVFGIHIQVAPSTSLIHVINTKCGGWNAAWM